MAKFSHNSDLSFLSYRSQFSLLHLSLDSIEKQKTTVVTFYGEVVWFSERTSEAWVWSKTPPRSESGSVSD